MDAESPMASAETSTLSGAYRPGDRGHHRGHLRRDPVSDMADIAARRTELLDTFGEWTPHTLGQWLDDRAARYGDRPLVITDEQTFTYAETAERATALADGLVTLGVRPGDQVGLLLANFAEFVPLKFAIAKAGAVAVPLNYLYRADELAYVLAQSECRVLITMTGFAGLDHLGMLDEIAPGWAEIRREDRRLPLLHTVIQLDTDGRERPGVLTVDELASLGERHSGAMAGIETDPAAVGDILYTSGTTGAPKGVMVTHDAVLRTGFASALTRAFADGRRILFSLPCYHMFGYVEGIIAATIVGGAVIPQPTFSPEGYLSGIERHRATDILCVPTMTIALLEHPKRHDYDLSSDGYLEVTGCAKELYKSGGELVMPKEIEELPTARPEISQAYLVGLPDERWGDAGCACVVRAPGSGITAAQVIEICKTNLARFKVPKHVVFLTADELPTTPTGKVRKFRLVDYAKQRLERQA